MKNIYSHLSKINKIKNNKRNILEQELINLKTEQDNLNHQLHNISLVMNNNRANKKNAQNLFYTKINNSNFNTSEVRHFAIKQANFDEEYNNSDTEKEEIKNLIAENLNQQSNIQGQIKQVIIKLEKYAQSISILDTKQFKYL